MNGVDLSSVLVECDGHCGEKSNVGTKRKVSQSKRTWKRQDIENCVSGKVRLAVTEKYPLGYPYPHSAFQSDIHEIHLGNKMHSLISYM